VWTKERGSCRQQLTYQLPILWQTAVQQTTVSSRTVLAGAASVDHSSPLWLQPLEWRGVPNCLARRDDAGVMTRQCD